MLSVFASYVSEGMIPNRFDDYTNEPHYNTVDASLWFIHAAFEYLRLVEGPRRRSTQCCCPRAGRSSTATAAARASTSRWTSRRPDHAGRLTHAAHLDGRQVRRRRVHAAAGQGGRDQRAVVPRAGADGRERAGRRRSTESFRKAFWISPFRGLADVVERRRHAGHGRSARTRSSRSACRTARCTTSSSARWSKSCGASCSRPSACARSPAAIRNTAAATAARRWSATSAYHNGTVWPWLIGAFLEAYLKVNGRSPQSIEQAERWLAPLIDHMDEDACIGSDQRDLRSRPAAPPGRLPARRRGASRRCCGWRWSWGCSPSHVEHRKHMSPAADNNATLAERPLGSRVTTRTIESETRRAGGTVDIPRVGGPGPFPAGARALGLQPLPGRFRVGRVMRGAEHHAPWVARLVPQRVIACRSADIIVYSPSLGQLYVAWHSNLTGRSCNPHGHPSGRDGQDGPHFAFSSLLSPPRHVRASSVELSFPFKATTAKAATCRR